MLLSGLHLRALIYVFFFWLRLFFLNCERWCWITARRASFCLRLAFVMIHLIYAGVLFLFDGDMIEKTINEPWYVCALLIVFLFCYFICKRGCKCCCIWHCLLSCIKQDIPPAFLSSNVNFENSIQSVSMDLFKWCHMLVWFWVLYINFWISIIFLIFYSCLIFLSGTLLRTCCCFPLP